MDFTDPVKLVCAQSVVFAAFADAAVVRAVVGAVVPAVEFGIGAGQTDALGTFYGGVAI